MKILFSPIGTADPITQLGDGPMLHIVRHHKPDKVVLFLSPKMCEFQSGDSRYTEAIRRLSDTEGIPLPDVQLIESSYEDVHRFDYYISEFESILVNLCQQSPEAPVLVNVSSGTPGMLQALVALGSFGRLRLKLLQVSSPRRGINKREDREKPNDYDLDALWEFNEVLREEDPEARVSRIIEVTTPNFTERLIRENVIALVRDYEYQAAYELASESQGIADDTKTMILAARDRLNLQGSLPAKVFARTAICYSPNDLLGECLSVMEVRLEQGHWADFVRLLTPAFTALCKETLRHELPEQSYLQVDKSRPTSKLNWSAIDHNIRLSRVFDRWNMRRPLYITNEMLAALIDEYCEDVATRDKLGKLRRFERNCRNKLAHELKASSKESLERIGGLTLDEVLAYLFDLHGNMREHLYADISQSIVDRL